MTMNTEKRSDVEYYVNLLKMVNCFLNLNIYDKS